MSPPWSAPRPPAGLDHLGNDDPGRVPGRARHGDRSSRRSRPTRRRRSRATSPSARRSCGSSTRARWAGSGSWRSAAAWPAGPRTGGLRLPPRPRWPAGACRVADHTARGRHRTASDRPISHVGIGRSTYCPPAVPGRTIHHGRARPDGERRANLHARSARAAPRHPRPNRPHDRSVDLVRPPPGHAPTARMSTRTANACRACGCALDSMLRGSDAGPRARRWKGVRWISSGTSWGSPSRACRSCS